MGEGKTSGSARNGAYHEPSGTEEDCSGTASSLGKCESTAKEGGLARLRSFSSNRKESGNSRSFSYGRWSRVRLVLLRVFPGRGRDSG
jgi:hypothetical protein